MLSYAEHGRIPVQAQGRGPAARKKNRTLGLSTGMSTVSGVVKWTTDGAEAQWFTRCLFPPRVHSRKTRLGWAQEHPSRNGPGISVRWTKLSALLVALVT